MKPDQLLFRTVHGSKLYGLDHANSDADYWEIYANQIPSPAKYIKQKIDGQDDTTRMNLSTFMLYADRSSHQVLDCMFAPNPEVDLIKDLRDRFVLNIGTFVPLYRRTIKAFWLAGDFKSQRHAARMCYQLEDGMRRGRFNPTLNYRQFTYLTSDLNGLVTTNPKKLKPESRLYLQKKFEVLVEETLGELPVLQ